jgi:hypothetical protein
MEVFAMPKKKKRPYYETADRVIAAFDSDPKQTSRQIADKLGLHSAYVRKALARNGRALYYARVK